MSTTVNKERVKKRKFVLKINKHSIQDADREVMLTTFKHVAEMNRLANKASKDMKKIFEQEIKLARSSLRTDYAYKIYEVVLKLGRHSVTDDFPEEPTFEDIKDLKRRLLDDIAEQKAERSVIHRVTKNFQGMSYSMVAPRSHTSTRLPREDFPSYVSTAEKIMEKTTKGNFLPSLVGGGAVFDAPNSIVNMLTSPEYSRRISRPKIPYDSSNYVGVELELITKVSRDTLNNMFIAAKLAGSVYVKSDSSIRIEKDNEVAHEVTLIAKDQNIYNVVQRVCDILNSPDVGGYVNNSCGLHVHIDMRNRDPEVCYHNYRELLWVLKNMVPATRTEGSHAQTYCALTCDSTFDVAARQGRYRAINAASYGSHRTIENRLHSGSTNAMKINNWIKLLLAVTNRKDKVFQVTDLADLKEHFAIDDELMSYIKQRTEKFTNRNVDTRKDHFETLETAV